MRCIYASALYRAENATFDDVREAVATLDELARTTRRVFGGAHPLAVTVAEDLENVQGKLRKQEELEDMGQSPRRRVARTRQMRWRWITRARGCLRRMVGGRPSSQIRSPRSSRPPRYGLRTEAIIRRRRQRPAKASSNPRAGRRPERRLWVAELALVVDFRRRQWHAPCVGHAGHFERRPLPRGYMRSRLRGSSSGSPTTRSPHHFQGRLAFMFARRGGAGCSQQSPHQRPRRRALSPSVISGSPG